MSSEAAVLWRPANSGLADRDLIVNRKRIQRLMRTMGLTAIYPKRNTSKANHAHKIYPYLLKGLTIDRPNMVWSTDITYIPMARGFVYLVAVIDWYSRRVLSWRLSNTLNAAFCVNALEYVIEAYGPPEIFNTERKHQALDDRAPDDAHYSYAAKLAA